MRARTVLHPLVLPLLALLAPACQKSMQTSQPTSSGGAETSLKEPTASRDDRSGAATQTETVPQVMASAATPPATATAPAKDVPADGDRFAGHAGAAGKPASAAPPAPAPFAAAPRRAEAKALDSERESTWIAGGGSIKAGEWDDNANYREFQRYLANEESLPIHRVDVSDRHFLVVRDSEGKAVPGCTVFVSDPREHMIRLTTTASGRAILFPHAEQMVGERLVATARCNDATANASFPMVDQDGVVDLHLQSARSLPEVRTIDVAFILDTTGSMSEEISAVKSTIGKVAQTLRQQNFGVRIGLVEYKDHGDIFLTKTHPMSARVDRFLADVAGISAAGGGDTPEDVQQGVHVALTQLEWNRDAVGHFAFLIGDAPPHLDYPNDPNYAVDMKDAAHRGVQMFTIAASGMDDLGQAVWRQIAQYTGATNLFVLRGGAGPQSTGAGDPKSSCGGTQTQYASGNLDALIVSKIQHELKGLDRDPMRIAGLHVDENAKPCNERVAFEGE